MHPGNPLGLAQNLSKEEVEKLMNRVGVGTRTVEIDSSAGVLSDRPSVYPVIVPMSDGRYKVVGKKHYGTYRTFELALRRKNVVIRSQKTSTKSKKGK